MPPKWLIEPIVAGALIIIFATWPTAAAEVEPHARDPYRITVALDFANHAALTPILADGVERQTSDQLRRLFGDLAQVSVVRRHPLIDRLAQSNLAELVLSPPELRSKELFPDNCDAAFLFQLDYRNGFYIVSWRQINRELGQIGPLQTRTTPDRAWLGKAVCLAVNDDFAPTAVITPTTDAHKVELAFHGSQARGWQRLQRWLTPGTVLQPYWVVLESDGELARLPVPYTVLRIEGETSSYWARVETNLPQPWRHGTRIVGFQAARLLTRSGQLSLRLVDQTSGSPVQAATVYANDRGFDSISDADLLGSPDPNGQLSAVRTFDQVAYIRIRQGAGSAIDVPLPMTADRCDVVCRLPVDRAATKKGDFERELGYLVDDVRALEAVLAERIREINQTNADKRYEEAERIGRALLLSLDKQVVGLKRAVGIIHQEAKELGQDKNPRLNWLTQQLAEVERQQSGLQSLAANLSRTIERNDAQGRANVLIELGNQSLRDGNIDDTLDKYTLALGEQPDQPQLAQYVARLNKQWEIKNPEHGASRRFIYETWPGVDLPSLETRLPEAERAFDQLEKAADRLTALKLLKADEKHLAALDQLVQQLADKTSEQDQAEHEKYVALLEQLAKLQQRVAAFCEADMPQGLRAAAESTPKATENPSKPAASASPEKAAAPNAPMTPAPQTPAAKKDNVPAKKPAPAPKPRSKPKSPLDEEEPPLGHPTKS